MTVNGDDVLLMANRDDALLMVNNKSSLLTVNNNAVLAYHQKYIIAVNRHQNIRSGQPSIMHLFYYPSSMPQFFFTVNNA